LIYSFSIGYRLLSHTFNCQKSISLYQVALVGNYEASTRFPPTTRTNNTLCNKSQQDRIPRRKLHRHHPFDTSHISQMMADTSATPKTIGRATRLAFLDNLRFALTALVIFHHTAIPYGGGGKSIPSSFTLVAAARFQCDKLVIPHGLVLFPKRYLFQGCSSAQRT
jgi:hypothetical protein